MSRFVLTDEQIERGLRQEDFSAYAGHRVISFYFTDFPGWPEMIDSGLTAAQRDRRAKAIRDAVLPLCNTYSKAMAERDAELAIPGSYPLTYSNAELVYDRLPSGHFRDILKSGVDEAIDACDQPFILPGVVYGHAWRGTRDQALLFIPGDTPSRDERVPLKRMFDKATSILYRYPPDIPARTLWHLFTNIPRGELTHFPDGNIPALLLDLHEMRHLRQCEIVAKGNRDILRHYQEIDADLFAFSVLRRAGIGAEARKAWIHMRYLGALGDHDYAYSFAPVLEAFEARKFPPDYASMYAATDEIRIRVAKRLAGEAYTLSSAVLQKDIRLFNAGAEKNRFPAIEQALILSVEKLSDATPREMYSTLRRLVEEGAFTDQLSRHIARHIVEAAEYFNPDLTQMQAIRPALSATTPVSRLVA